MVKRKHDSEDEESAAESGVGTSEDEVQKKKKQKRAKPEPKVKPSAAKGKAKAPVCGHYTLGIFDAIDIDRFLAGRRADRVRRGRRHRVQGYWWRKLA